MDTNAVAEWTDDNAKAARADKSSIADKRVAGLDACVRALIEEVHTLTVRLRPVLRPEETADSVDPQMREVESPLSPLLDELRRIEGQVGTARDLVKDALERLEI